MLSRRVVLTTVLGLLAVLQSPLQANAFTPKPPSARPADLSCYSLESGNFPGQYLRHSNYRLQKASDDGTDTFRKDATFCAQPPRAGGAGNVSLQSFNYPTYYVRHSSELVYIATASGANPWDGGASYDADTTWADQPELGG